MQGDAELLFAIRRVYAGHRLIDPRLSDSLADMLTGRAEAGFRLPRSHLSHREAQVLQGVVKGFTSQEIAKQLNLNSKTIETYRSRIYTKLALHTRADLVQYAIAADLLATEEA